jgi:hypothetical protein
MHEHPLIAFKDGPAGRRARLVGGPDVWEVIGAVHSVRAALASWGDHPEEVEAFLDRARAEAAQARASWERQQELLGR